MMGKRIIQLVVVVCCSLIAPAGSQAQFFETFYVEIGDPLVVNYGVPSLGRLKYMRVNMQFRVQGESDRGLVEYHLPILRHALVMLLSNQLQHKVSSAEGKEDIRLEALAVAQDVMIRELGDETIEDVLFTNFVVQR
jgi:flagellar FliL protein